MKCPHCQVAFHWNPVTQGLLRTAEASWYAVFTSCPTCGKLVVKLEARDIVMPGSRSGEIPDQEVLVFPRRTSSRPPCPPEVPESIAKRYKQACLILEDSPEAAAALGRRCLQQVLREEAGVTPGKLANEIKQVVASGQIPPSLAATIDHIRHYGNFAAHATEDKVTGEIIDVEPGEAEWTLTTLETVFDVYYVGPARVKAEKQKLSAKLQASGQKG